MLKPDSCIWGVWHVVWHRAGELGSSVSSLSTDSLLQKDSGIQDPVVPMDFLVPLGGNNGSGCYLRLKISSVHAQRRLYLWQKANHLC